jgi:hypothetical protein
MTKTPAQYIDALSYIDTEFNDPITQRSIKLLISQEAKTKTFNIEDYVSHIDAPSWDFKYSRLGLKDEFENHDRVGKYVPLKERLQNNQSQRTQNEKLAIESQNLQLTSLNLQLLNKYGSHAWKTYNTHLEQTQQS